MNLTDRRYKDFALVQEMMEVPAILRRFDLKDTEFGGARQETTQQIWNAGRLFLTGEGSSRIFPAKNMIYDRMRMGFPLQIVTDAARQAHQYNLMNFAVFGASNSGRTKEVISLFTQLAENGHQRRFGLTAHENTPLAGVSTRCHMLTCGKENAVAATKSVVEQALFYRMILCYDAPSNRPFLRNQTEAAEKAQEVLQTELDPAMVRDIAAAPMIYFAGRNNGVAEELTLKTNEITKKKSDYLEGTYAVHGIEEVMDPDEVVIVIDPFPAEMAKFKEVLSDGVKMKVFAVAQQETVFPTIRIPPVEGYETILQLLAGWNILVHVGVALGLDLDTAKRARKIGNQYDGG
jgi:glucosamine--fructose-6-phosphate aminotransferase (isomerizing)